MTQMWEQSEGALRQALKELDVEYYESVGDAAFYGPKLDVQVANVLGKDETISTVQIDFTLPERFDLEYIGEDGQPHRPVMIHRGGISTLERFMAFLIENYAGAFPLWLAPVQAVVIPISDESTASTPNSVAERLREAGLRAEVDARHERMNAKVRDAQLQKIPYMLVVGDKEAAADAVAVRLRSNENLGAVPIDDFIRQAKQIVADRSQELLVCPAACVVATTLGHSSSLQGDGWPLDVGKSNPEFVGAGWRPLALWCIVREYAAPRNTQHGAQWLDEAQAARLEFNDDDRRWGVDGHRRRYITCYQRQSTRPRDRARS